MPTMNLISLTIFALAIVLIFVFKEEIMLWAKALGEIKQIKHWAKEEIDELERETDKEVLRIKLRSYEIDDEFYARADEDWVEKVRSHLKEDHHLSEEQLLEITYQDGPKHLVNDCPHCSDYGSIWKMTEELQEKCDRERRELQEKLDELEG